MVLEGAPARGNPGYRAVRSLYIHVPFCFHKCHYCDFYSFVDTQDRQEPFVRRLIRELQALSPWAAGEPLRTVFVGGGTPSLLRQPLWTVLLDALHSHFDLSLIRAGAGEFTVECNPETVTPELLQALRQGGVDRVSLGAQSFQPGHLKTLERWHDPASVARSVELVRAAGFPRWSLDLIYAIPGQTLQEWLLDLETALSLSPSHLSCYNLTFEPNTPMTRRLQRGEFRATPDDVAGEMFQVTGERLRRAGLHRYEVSNYATPGQESRHNLAYWRGEEWLAAGPSASAHVRGHRWKNIPRLGDYLSFDDDGFAPIQDHEIPDARRALAEDLMCGIRLAEGVEAAPALARAAALDPRAPSRLLSEFRAYEAVGDLRFDSGRWMLTDAGFLRADAVAADLIGALEAQPDEDAPVGQDAEER
ncbi:MAG: radical SAM family heme chaperone HemW [Phycisphaerales bacterium]|nr:radical SAM family heme chaperone HemW [Phycisphaerales bacterium]